jgi:hypothetical protein
MLSAVVCAVAITFGTRSYLARRRYERLKMSGGRKALVRNLFGG